MRLSFNKFAVGIVFLIGCSCLGEFSYSQDLDLGIPGLEEEVATQPASTGTSEGTAAKGSVNLLDMIKAGGWSMWVLGTFSLGVIGLLVFCLIDLQNKNFAPKGLEGALRQDMETMNLEAGLGKVRSDSSCLGAVLRVGFDHISEFGFDTIRSDDIKQAMANAAKKFNRGRVRTINYFSIFAQAAPMMGLLGTVSGMIGAFAKLSQGGTGDPSKFAGNISEALITTASGLVVALPSIFCYFIFRDRLQTLVAQTDESAEELLTILRRAYANYQSEHHQQ